MAQANRSLEIGTGLFVLLGFVALGLSDYTTTRQWLTSIAGVGELRCDRKIR